MIIWGRKVTSTWKREKETYEKEKEKGKKERNNDIDILKSEKRRKVSKDIRK